MPSKIRRKRRNAQEIAAEAGALRKALCPETSGGDQDDVISPSTGTRVIAPPELANPPERAPGALATVPEASPTKTKSGLRKLMDEAGVTGNPLSILPNRGGKFKSVYESPLKAGNPEEQQWCAQIWWDLYLIHLGSFDSEKEAKAFLKAQHKLLEARHQAELRRILGDDYISPDQWVRENKRRKERPVEERISAFNAELAHMGCL